MTYQGLVPPSYYPEDHMQKNDELSKELREDLRALGLGCTDGDCVWRTGTHGGMHTNGGCNCLPLRMLPSELAKVRRGITLLLNKIKEHEDSKTSLTFV